MDDTDMVRAAAPPAVAAGRVFLTSGATSPELPGRIPPSLFLACFGDNVQAAAAAEYAYNVLGTQTAAVLYASNDTYTNLLQQYFRTRFEELGGSVVSVQQYSGTDLSGPIANLPEADLIFLSALPGVPPLVAQLRDTGVSVPIMGGDGYDEAGWDAYPTITDVYFTTHVYLGYDNPDPDVAAFRSAYNAAFPGSPVNAFAALGYDAINLLAKAIDNEGSAAPSDVLDGMSTILNFDGVTGTIGYPGGTRIPVKSVTLVEISGGSFHFKEEFIPTSVPAP